MAFLDTQSSSSVRSGCGCGSPSGGAGCACGLPDCNVCKGQGFLRPRFFAGQLLTEDDLELLSAYVTGKDRLRNRALYGHGVVCGLDLRCHPCDDGRIVLSPGYALDGCGNDIVVPCEQIVDVLALARELGERMLGSYGCQDPCQSVDAGAGGTRKEADGEPEPPRDPHRYGLYIRYCEELSEPIMPYATGDACGRDACEASRVREGFRFELRCVEDDPPAKDVLSTLMTCLGDVTRLEGSVNDGARMQRDANKIATAVTAIQESDTVTFAEEHANRMTASRAGLNRWLETGGHKLNSTREELLLVGHHLSEFAGMLVRYFLLDDGKREEAYERFQHIRYYVDHWQESRAFGEKLLSEIHGTSGITVLEAAWLEAVAEMTLASMPQLEPDAQRRLWAEGVTYSPSLQAHYVGALAELRDHLLARLAPGRPISDCALRADTLAVDLEALMGSHVSIERASLLRQAVDELVGALLRYLFDCICRATMPPCPTVGDPAVLLAHIDLEQCKVTSICNTERRYVLSSTAMRYWLPPLGWLGAMLEFVCCTVRGSLAEPGGARALAAWLGLRQNSDGDYGVKLSAAHLQQVIAGYYGTGVLAPSDLVRLPAVLGALVDAAMHRVAAPAEAISSKPQYEGSLVDAAVARYADVYWERNGGRVVGSELDARLPDALRAALAEGEAREAVVSVVAGEVRRDNRELHEAVESMSSEVARLERSYNGHRGSIKRQLDDVDRKLSGFADKAEFDAELGRLRTENKTLQEELSDIRRQLQELRGGHG
ncbi:hypothetical protein [Haliangium sp.]|uniref:hypothetical protein n=1 Tax=Haliangium sp. TaxID=2663208 RepID=UPI003D10E6BC